MTMEKLTQVENSHDIQPVSGVALTKIESVINDQEIAQQQFDFLITNNEHLPDQYKSISLTQFIDIITKLREGLIEATKCTVENKIMGNGAIATDIAWVQGMIQGIAESKIGYQKDTDTFLVTARCVAELADSEAKSLGYPYDKLGGKVVRAKDLALLLMAEEASHRYDIQVKGLEFADTTKDRQHPVEKNSQQVIAQIVEKLAIPTS